MLLTQYFSKIIRQLLNNLLLGFQTLIIQNEMVMNYQLQNILFIMLSCRTISINTIFE